MPNINRLKVVLVEKGKTGRWFTKELGKSNCTINIITRLFDVF